MRINPANIVTSKKQEKSDETYNAYKQKLYTGDPTYMTVYIVIEIRIIFLCMR